MNNFIVKMPILLLTISWALTIAGFFSKYGWWFDMASYFRLQYMAFQILCVLLCIPKKKWKLMGVSFIFLIVNLACIVPSYVPSHQITKNEILTQKTLTILQINVYTGNNQYTKVINYIKEINPDILALEEINNEWLTALFPVLSNYPYNKAIARGDNFGIGLFSKVQPEDITIKYYGSVGVPSTLTTFNLRVETL